MRVWYLRRAVPWGALLGCLASAVFVAVLVHRWPDTGWIGLPLLVVSCAAAAAFVYDEPASAVASVTPRSGWWRGSTRLLTAILPLAVSVVLLTTMPAELRLDRGGWLLIAAACVLLTVTPAAWLAGRQVGRPGSAIASAAVIIGIAPLVLAAILGWESVFPLADVPDGIRKFWLVLAVGSGVCCLASLVTFGRPGIRRPVRTR